MHTILSQGRGEARGSLRSPGCSGIDSVDQAVLELLESHLPLPLSTGIKSVSPHQASVCLFYKHPGIYSEPKVWEQLSKIKDFVCQEHYPDNLTPRPNPILPTAPATPLKLARI